MAHNLDNSTGKTAFVSFQEPAWHGLGTIVNNVLSANEALRLGGLDFKVNKSPSIQRLSSSGSEYISKRSFFTYRTDTNKILGENLGNLYTVIQNFEAFEIVNEILQSGTASIETAGAINGGATVFICMKLNKDVIVNGNDITKQYLVIANAHDGSKALTVLFTNIRVVCNNTLSAALSESRKEQIKLRHTTNIVDKLRDAATVLKVIKDNTEMNEKNYNEMAALKISKEEMWDYFGNVYFSPSDIAQLRVGKNSKDVVSSVKRNALNKVANFAINGIGQLETLDHGNLTMWTAYNAVTGSETKKKFATCDDRAESLLFGTSATRIREAGVLALNPKTILPLYSKKINDINLN